MFRVEQAKSDRTVNTNQRMESKQLEIYDSGMLKRRVEQVCTDYTMPCSCSSMQFYGPHKRSPQEPEIDKIAEPPKSKQFAHSD